MRFRSLLSMFSSLVLLLPAVSSAEPRVELGAGPRAELGAQTKAAETSAPPAASATVGGAGPSAVLLQALC